MSGGIGVDYTLEDNLAQMPRPYVQFIMDPQEKRDAEGKVSVVDVIMVKVTAQGSKDTLYKPALDWFETLDQNAQNDRIPQNWPSLYREAYEKFKKGEELPVDGYPIKNWPGCTPAQRKTILGMGILTVEDLAKANDQVQTALGMAGGLLVRSAKAWVEQNQGGAAMAGRLRDLEGQNQLLQSSLEEAQKAMKELKAKVDAMAPAPANQPKVS